MMALNWNISAGDGREVGEGQGARVRGCLLRETGRTRKVATGLWWILRSSSSYISLFMVLKWR